MNRFTWMWVASVCAILASGCGLVLDTQTREGSGSDAGTGGNDTGVNGCVDDIQCDDGNVCNGAELCVDHACVSTDAIMNCDDGVDCTVDECHPVLGCRYTPDDSACDTGLCVAGEGCQQRSCSTARDCGPPDCGGLFSCVDEMCVRGPAVVCADQIGQCLIGGCANGACVYVPDSRRCNSTANPSCAISECMPNGMCGTPVPYDELCEDGIECTENTCVLNTQTRTGTCMKRNVDAICDDGVLCTLERCAPEDPNVSDDGSGCVRQLSDSVCRSIATDTECTAPVCLPTGCEDGVQVLPCLDGGVCDVDTGYCDYSEGCPDNCADFGSPCAPAICLGNTCVGGVDPCVVNLPGFMGYCDVSGDAPRCAVRLAPISILPGGLP